MITNKRIHDTNDLIDIVNELGILQFWREDGFSSWSLSAVNFNALWSIREEAVNSRKIAYGKFVGKKATFVSLDIFPYLCSLRRDGYDFDSLSDEGRAPNRELIVMSAVGTALVPSYALGRSSGIKGYDAVVTSLQNKTYLCLQFKKSMMGTALLCRPEDIFGSEFVRSKYSLTPEQNAEYIMSHAPGLQVFSQQETAKILSPAI